MRFSAFITALAIVWTAEAEIRFTEPRWFPDLALSLPLPAGFTADPLGMPRAEAYLVTSADGRARVEDRYDTWDLWTALVVRGRWRDEAGNVFTVCRLSHEVPDDAAGTLRTRGDFFARLVPSDPEDAEARDTAVRAAAPVDLGRAVRPRRAQRRDLSGLWYYACTNANVIAYAFRPRTPERDEAPEWYLAVLECAEDESLNAANAAFDADFLDRVALPARRARPAPGAADIPPPAAKRPRRGARAATPDESALLRTAYRRGIANYAAWHCTETEGAVIVDDLDGQSAAAFIPALTNALPRFRRAFAERFPSPCAATNTLAAVRVFRDRTDYLAYVGEEARWTAALWSPTHREVVACLAADGAEDLLRTAVHECFHQYLAYAGALVSAAPWFNEGHAQLFQHAHPDARGKIVFERPDQVRLVQQNADRLAEAIPALMKMDYLPREGEPDGFGFYAGDPDAVQAHYTLAWSIAYFLEVGAPKVRFRPFADVRAAYLRELVRLRDGRAATAAVFNAELLADFVAEWRAFWKRN